MARRFATTLRAALSIALIGGVLLGSAEGIATLHANAFVQPGQYFWVYLTVPVLSWIGLAVAIMVPLAFVAALRPQPPGLWLYAFVLALTGSVSILLPVLTAAGRGFADVSFNMRSLQAVMWTVGIGVALAAAAVVAAAAAWYASRAVRPLAIAAPVAALVGLLCLIPSVAFLASDWKWGGSSTPRASSDAGLPNVVLISIDTLRADHLGSYGAVNNPTPHLDRLAREGVLFEQAITSSPWTLPAVASMHTGSYPRRHGAGAIDNRRDPLGRSALATGSWTVARALRARGYTTYAIVTNPYLALRYGLGEGFDGYQNVTIESEAFLAFQNTTLVRLISWLWPQLIVGDRGEVVSARARSWLHSAPKNHPFFLWLHYIDPHPPYSRAGITTHKSFRGDSLLGARADDGLDLRLTSPDVARLRSGEIRLNNEEKEAVHALYRAEVASVDSAVGTVLDSLDELGLRERTLLICISDHGEEFWEHGGVEHGHTVYEELVRIPLLIRWPGRLPAGKRVTDVVRIVDVAPTLTDLLSLGTPSPIDGASLLPLLEGRESVQRAALVENMLFADERVGLRTPRHKYVRWEIGKEEAYDLGIDPDERRDLAGVDTVVGPLRHLFAQTDDVNPTTRTVRNAPKLDGPTIEAMRALGYVH